MKKMAILLVMGLFFLVTVNVTYAEDAVIKLPDPQTEGGMPLMKALKLRKSTRGNFGPDTKLSMQQISNLLWAADGVNRENGYRTAPSAANWQNIDIYVMTADGLYLYDAKNNVLKVLGNKDVRSASGGQEFVNDAPVNLIYIADYSHAAYRGNKDVAETWSYANTGFIAQNVYLFCASEGLACIVRANADKDLIRKTLNLRPDQHFILAQTIAHFK